MSHPAERREVAVPSGEQRNGTRWTVVALLTMAGILLALRMVHLDADFPAYHFYSQDGARYSDEGFYTSAALHYYTLGHAYVPGGWNPGVFMPVWPLMVGLLFHVTGVGAAAARALAVVCTWGSVLLAYGVSRQYRSQTFAAWTAFLVAVNALGFFFGRLALLEPAFVLFVLLAIYLAGRVRPGNYGMAVLAGVAFTLATLTKTTGPFVLPAVLYPIWANNRRNDRAAAWKLTVTALAAAILLLELAKLGWMRHYAADAAVILGINPRWQIEHSPVKLARFFFRGTWIDPVLFPLALAGFVAAILRVRSLWRDVLFVTAVLWETGYAAFIVFHYDGPPRYFVAMIVPTVWLAMLFTEWLWREHRTAALAVCGAIAASVVWNAACIGNYLAHPRYTLLDASQAIGRIVTAGPAAHPPNGVLLMGRGVDEVSLLAGGIPSIDTDGSMPLAEKVDVYPPEWFMNWTDDSMARPATVAEKRRLVWRASFPGLDPFNGAGIVLYRVQPLYRVEPSTPMTATGSR